MQSVQNSHSSLRWKRVPPAARPTLLAVVPFAAVLLLGVCAAQTQPGTHASAALLGVLLPLVIGLLAATLVYHAGVVAAHQSWTGLAYVVYAAAALTAAVGATAAGPVMGPTATPVAGAVGPALAAVTVARVLPGLYLLYTWVLLKLPDDRPTPPTAYGVIWVLYGLTVAASLLAYATADPLLLVSANRMSLLLAALVFALVPARGIAVRMDGTRLPATLLVTHMLSLLLAPAFVLLGLGLLPLRAWYVIVPPLFVGLEVLLTLPTSHRRIVSAERRQGERDLTERLRFEQQLRAELEQEFRHAICDPVSREGRTLLNSILGFAALLGDTPLSPRQQRYVEGIHSATNSLTNVLAAATGNGHEVHDVYDVHGGHGGHGDHGFHRAHGGHNGEAGETVDSMWPSLSDGAEASGHAVDVVAAAQDALKALAGANDNRHIELQVAPGFPRRAHIDGRRLTRLLVHLLHVVVRQAEDSPVELALEYHERDGEQDDDGTKKTQEIGKGEYRFVVRENGTAVSVGVGPRNAEGTQRDAHGTELSGKLEIGPAGSAGLEPGPEVLDGSAVRRIAREIGGDLLLDNRRGKGLELIFCFMAAPMPTKKPAARARRGAPEEGTAELKVLVVDDFQMNREMLHAMLRVHLPCSRFRDARDGLEAVEAYQEFQPDLVLMDVRMPRLDGRDASRKIRVIEARSQRHAAIVGMSAGVSVGETERCRTAGMDAVIGKPIDTEALGTVLDRLRTTKLLRTL